MHSCISFAEKLSSQNKQKQKHKHKLKKKLKTIRKKIKANSYTKKTNIAISSSNSSNNHKRSNTLKKHKAKAKQANQESNFIKFMLGFGVGFGLKVDASEDLKKCFLADKEKNGMIIKNFIFESTENNNSNHSNILAEEKENQKQSALSFTKTAMEFFVKFKDCNAFKETLMTFIKNKVINLGIKGIAYIFAGPLGILLKGTYDIYKIITEIGNFYQLKKQSPVDYYNLGSAVGKIIYYTQNILLRRKKRF